MKIYEEYGLKPKDFFGRSNQMASKLRDAVLKWWEKHKNDISNSVYGEGGDSWNTYPVPPEFVKIAQKLKKE